MSNQHQSHTLVSLFIDSQSCDVIQIISISSNNTKNQFSVPDAHFLSSS